MTPSVDIKTGPSTIEVCSAHALFGNRMIAMSVVSTVWYDVTQDGKLFLVVTQEGGGVQAPITMVVNWVGEVKKK